MNASDRRYLYERYTQMVSQTAHDPIDRALPDEPHFVLLARDPTAAELVRMWVAIRKRDTSLIDAIAKRLKERVARMPYRPKDAEHVISAQQVSNAMDLWLVEQQTANPSDGAEQRVGVDTFAKLQAEILDTLDRTDLITQVTQYAPGSIERAVTRAIAKAERRIVRRLRTREFETSTTIATAPGVETVALPADFVMMKMLILAGTPSTVLAQKDLVSLHTDSPGTVAGRPRAYAAFGPSLYLRPIPDGVTELKMFYYAAPKPLSAENPSNTLLVKYPDLLLYGALIEVTAHVDGDDRTGLWKAAFDETVRDILNDDTLNRWSGAPVRGEDDARGIA